jgi:hypothetical protein
MRTPTWSVTLPVVKMIQMGDKDEECISIERIQLESNQKVQRNKLTLQ